jgi:hypothetical protein
VWICFFDVHSGPLQTAKRTDRIPRIIVENRAPRTRKIIWRHKGTIIIRSRQKGEKKDGRDAGDDNVFWLFLSGQASTNRHTNKINVHQNRNEVYDAQVVGTVIPQVLIRVHRCYHDRILRCILNAISFRRLHLDEQGTRHSKSTNIVVEAGNQTFRLRSDLTLRRAPRKLSKSEHKFAHAYLQRIKCAVCFLLLRSRTLNGLRTARSQTTHQLTPIKNSESPKTQQRWHQSSLDSFQQKQSPYAE